MQSFIIKLQNQNPGSKIPIEGTIGSFPVQTLQLYWSLPSAPIFFPKIMRKVQNFVFDFCNSAAVVKVNKKKESKFLYEVY